MTLYDLMRGQWKKELDQEQPQLLWSWVDQTMSNLDEHHGKRNISILFYWHRWCWGHKKWPKAQTSNIRYVLVTDITSQGLFVRSHHSLWVSSDSVIHHGLGNTTKLPKLPLKVTPGSLTFGDLELKLQGNAGNWWCNGYAKITSLCT